MRKVGGTPILVTSLSRRNYKDGVLVVDPLHDYAAATRKVAADEHIAVVDLYADSTAMLGKMTQEQADQFNANAHPDAKAEGAATVAAPDHTHLNDLGKKTFGTMVLAETYTAVPALQPYIKLPDTLKSK